MKYRTIVADSDRQLAFAFPAELEFAIERVWLQGRAKPRGARETGALHFQRWLAQWKRLRDDGWDVNVLLAADEKHVVGLGCRLLAGPSA